VKKTAELPQRRRGGCHMNITNAWFKFHHCNMFQNIFAFITYLHPGNIQNIRKCHDFKFKTVNFSGVKEETHLK